MKTIEIKNKIIEQVELLSAKNIPNDDFDIFSSGYLDSLNVLHIIMFIESEFNIKVNPYDLSLDVLNSINKIVYFVQSKLV